MIRGFLVDVLLVQLVLAGSLALLALVGEFHSGRYWYYEAVSLRQELGACQLKHTQLIKQIKREGLWTRLAMGGQPWLQ